MLFSILSFCILYFVAQSNLSEGRNDAFQLSQRRHKRQITDWNYTRLLQPSKEVKVGRLTYISILLEVYEGKTYFSEDLTFELRTENDLPLQQTSWIEYNQELGRIEAFPMKGNEGLFRFLLIPLMHGQAYNHRYFIKVNVTRDETVLMHRVIFHLGLSSFRMFRERKLRIQFVQVLITYFRSLGMLVKRNHIQILESDSVSGNLVWQLTSVKTSTCDKIITRDLPKFLLDDQGQKPRQNLVAAFSGINFHIDEVRIDLKPPCYIVQQPKTEEENINSYLKPLIIVLVTILLVSPILVAIFLRKKMRRNRTKYQNPTPVTANQMAFTNHVTNYQGQFEPKISFSCWMFRRKGKSYKVNQRIRQQNKLIPDNIFDTKYLQRERLQYASNNQLKQPAVMSGPHRSRGYQEQFTIGYQESSRKSLSIASSNPSYSTSQDTPHSSFSLRTSPIHHLQSMKDPRFRQLNASTDSRNSSRCLETVQNCVNKNYVVHHERRPSVHLINIKPKTVNIHTTHPKPTEQHKHHRKQQNAKTSSSLHIDKFARSSRRHSDDSALRVHRHGNNKVPLRADGSRSATCTPTKQSNTKLNGSMSGLFSRSMEHGYGTPYGTPPQSFDRSLIDIRPSPRPDVQVYVQNAPSSGAERKSSLARRQEWMASRHKKAFEISSYEEIQSLRQIPQSDYDEDTV